MRHVYVRHLRGHRHQIVRQRAIGELALAIIDQVFVQGAANALHASAPHLLIGQLRIDQPATIFHHPVLEQAYKTRVGVDFHIGAVHAVGEDVEVLDQPEPPRVRQYRLAAARQLAQLKVANSPELRERQASAARSIDDDPIADVQQRRLGLQQLPGNGENFAFERARGLIDGFPRWLPPREPKVPPP